MKTFSAMIINAAETFDILLIIIYAIQLILFDDICTYTYKSVIKKLSKIHVSSQVKEILYIKR